MLTTSKRVRICALVVRSACGHVESIPSFQDTDEVPPAPKNVDLISPQFPFSFCMSEASQTPLRFHPHEAIHPCSRHDPHKLLLASLAATPIALARFHRRAHSTGTFTTTWKPSFSTSAWKAAARQKPATQMLPAPPRCRCRTAAARSSQV